MNESHLEFLASPTWASMLETDLLPWVEAAGDLGDDVLEIGPGPGLTTDLLRTKVARITAVELDRSLAESLERRMQGTTVQVIHGDATESDLGSSRFSAVLCFSVLHHIPTPDGQDRLFAEVQRVLKPGGIFVGVDALENVRAFHQDDDFTPIDPTSFPDRLARVGLTDTRVDLGDYQFRFVATKSLDPDRLQ